LSDFLCSDFEDSLKIANRKHDVVAINIYDRRERDLPAMGLVKFTDPETGAEQWVDTSNKQVRQSYNDYWKKQSARIHNVFRKSGVDYISVNTAEDYVQPLTAMFKKR
jgi:uncharacterized protein (DUF58 family)